MSERVCSLLLKTHADNDCVHTVEFFDSGYPNLAAFNDSSECFMLYRRFGYLQSRVLLDRQDEMRLLEEELDAFDRSNPSQLVSRAGLDESLATPRKDLLRRVETAFCSYCKRSAF